MLLSGIVELHRIVTVCPGSNVLLLPGALHKSGLLSVFGSVLSLSLSKLSVDSQNDE